MPTYLLHGFRWPRPLIRIHIILNNLDDAAAEWIMAPATVSCLTENFKKLHPTIMTSLPNLRFIEQYDTNDLTTNSQPYAYIADMVHEIKLGIEVDEVRGKGVGNEAWGAMVELRDVVAPGEKIAWWVVVCGDEERAVAGGSEMGSELSRVVTGEGPKEKKEKGRSKFAKLFGGGGGSKSSSTSEEKGLRKSKSTRTLNGSSTKLSASPPPPPPHQPLPAIPIRHQKQSHSVTSPTTTRPQTSTHKVAVLANESPSGKQQVYQTVEVSKDGMERDGVKVVRPAVGSG